MNKRPDSETSLDRLIAFLQSGQEQSISHEVLANLSDEEQQEFHDARQAILLLNKAKPSVDQRTIDTASVNNAETPADATNQLVDALPDIRHLGHYEILETLGQGGFGIVVKARDTKLGRRVALKIPKIDLLLQDQQATDRFAREARLVAMLSHPAIVPVYETGADGSLLFIASAYCNGGNLAHWFADRDKKIEPAVAARIVARLAEAVQHAHSRGVIHRDLKPGNVLLDFEEESRGDNDSIVDALRITDFGLAKFVSEDQSVTQTGATIGTPAYMSPEQARGSVDKIGPASDIYALGAILYELLSGNPPIIGESNIATMRAIETQTPIPVRKLNSSVSGDLSAICAKCLEKSPQSRYSTAHELHQDLRRFLEHQPVTARPISSTKKVTRWCQRNPWLAASTAMLFLALTVGIIVSTSFWLTAERANARALTQTSRVRQAVDELLTAIAEEPSIRSKNLERFRNTLLQSASNFYEQLYRERPTDPELQHEYVETLYRLALIHARLEDHEHAIQICDEALSLLNENVQTDKPMAIKLLNQQLTSLSVLGRFDDAQAQQAHAVSLSRELLTGNPDSDEWAIHVAAQISLAAAGEMARKDFAAAENYFDRSLTLVRDATGLSPLDWEYHPQLWQILSDYADFLAQTERYDLAQEYATKAIEMFESKLDPELEPSNSMRHFARLHNVLGMIGSHTGNHLQAEEHWTTTLILYELLKDRHPNVGNYADRYVSTAYSLALIKMFLGELPDCRNILDNNLTEIERLVPVFPELDRSWRIHEVNCLNLLYNVLRRQNDFQGARTAIENAVGKCQSLYGDYPDNYIASLHGNFLSNLGFLENTLGNYHAANESYVQAMEILEPIAFRQKRGESVRWLSNVYIGSAVSNQNMENYQTALDDCDAFLALVPQDELAPIVQKSRVELLSRLQQYDRSFASLNDLVDTATAKTGYFDLASQAAQCVAIIDEDLSESLDESLAREWHERFLTLSMELLRLTTATGELDAEKLLARIDSDANFDAVRPLESFRNFMAKLN